MSTAERDFDYIVAGLGGIGSAAAYWLARGGSGSVLGLEQFAFGHDRGSSEDHSRIIRLSYQTEAYVRLAQQAYEAWHALEADAGEQLLLPTGGLDFAHAAHAAGLEPFRRSMAACGVPFESLSGAQIMRRWPQFDFGRDEVVALYQEQTAIAMASRANAAHRRMAIAHGAELRQQAPIRELSTANGEIRVRTDDASYRCRKLILATGPWSGGWLARLGSPIALRVTQEQVSYLKPRSLAAFAPERFPIWIWHGEPAMYGFPVFGEAAIKIAVDKGGPTVTAEGRSFDPDPVRQAEVEQFVRDYLPGAQAEPLLTKTCLYTMTADTDFLLGPLPGHPDIFSFSGCGHGFKFASLAGRIFARLAAGEPPGADISAFRLDRPGLEHNPG